MKSENRSILTDENGFQMVVAEKQTLTITCTIQDAAGDPVTLAAISTLTLEIYARDHASKTDVLAQTDIKDTGRGAVHATSGLLTITLDPTDNAIIDDALDLEWHRAVIVATYNTSRIMRYEIDFPVRNLDKVS